MKKDEPKDPGKFSPDNPPNGAGEMDSLLAEEASFACDWLSSERYQAFIENINEGVYELDIHGKFVYFNNSLCKIFGYTREEIKFQHFSNFMDEEYATKGFETFRRIFETGEGISDLLWKINAKNGDIRAVELSANLIVNEEGKKTGFRGIARDITDRFRAQEALKKSERRFRTLLDFLPYPIVVFSLEGRVLYLNPAYTEIFGWSLEELRGKTIPYVPEGQEEEASETIRRLFKERLIHHHETQRLTKDGRVLDVVMSGAVYSETGDMPSGELVILRDITREKRIARNNEALLQTSMALPEYPDLEGLLDYISTMVKELLDVEGALVILLDEKTNELFFKSAVHDDSAAQERVKEIRFPPNQGVASKVISTGKPIIVTDTSKGPYTYSMVDTQAGFKTRSLLDVPLRNKDKIIGVLCAQNKKTGTFDETDVELLNMIAGTIALSIENARFSEELKEAYNEVTSLNRAKDKVINHLSHELKTPLSILSVSLNTLAKKLSSLPRETWRPTIERAQRNLSRILELQYQVEDIMQDRHYDTRYVLSRLLDECTDQLTALVADETGEGLLVEKIKNRIEEIFGSEESPVKEIVLGQFVPDIIREIKPLFSHRQVELITRFESSPAIRMPVSPLKKVVVGLIKNAIENTPDEGKIEIVVHGKGNGTELLVRDYGVGITDKNQKRIFEGFFTTQETMDYSSKRPFDFRAGGKGADLLRMKIFSERYNFKIDMKSSRCGHIPSDKDICPGRINKCDFSRKGEGCDRSGGTTFTVFFPAGSENGDSSAGDP